MADYKNNLITEIVYNCKNRSIISMNRESPDLLQGDIYQVQPAFMEKFKASGRKLSPKKDNKNKLLRSFTGEWNGKIVMSGEVFFDFEKTVPPLMKGFECPIASDCSFRPDVQYMLMKDIGRAQ